MKVLRLRSDFFVLFEDTGDGLLQVSEITQFSGVEVHPLDAFYDQLVAVPPIADMSSLSGDCPEPAWCSAMEQAYNLTARQWQAWMGEAYRPSYNVAPSRLRTG